MEICLYSSYPLTAVIYPSNAVAVSGLQLTVIGQQAWVPVGQVVNCYIIPSGQRAAAVERQRNITDCDSKRVNLKARIRIVNILATVADGPHG